MDYNLQYVRSLKFWKGAMMLEELYNTASTARRAFKKSAFKSLWGLELFPIEGGATTT
jgi:hypothetical protein